MGSFVAPRVVHYNTSNKKAIKKDVEGGDGQWSFRAVVIMVTTFLAERLCGN